jgi:type I restriction enzyme M protein
MNASTLVPKLWKYCDVLRDDGMSYGDYVEKFIDLRLADGRRANSAGKELQAQELAK